jgi:hypothetical protein
MFFIAACLSKQLPDLARAIMGGIAQNIAPYTRAFTGAIGAAAGGVGGAAIGGATGGPAGVVPGAAVGAWRGAALASDNGGALRLAPAGKAFK